MRRAFRFASSLLLWATGVSLGHAESTWEFSVQLSAAVQSSPAQITLTWPQDSYLLPNNYTVYRKAPGSDSWGSGVSLPGIATNYVDNSVSVGSAYEYQVVKTTSQYKGYGYIYSGMEVPLTDQRGKIVLVVDRTFAVDLASELSLLQQDLIGDGWAVTRVDVNRQDSPASVRNQIKAQYAADPANVKAVLLFGHVPVAYSGDIVPDGHVPDHQGAWPCDGYYGDMDGIWTDATVRDSGASDARNRNVPGDGKFDQSSFPAPLKLMVGRVDMANLPGRLSWGGAATFPSELELLRNYIKKDHAFRHGRFDLPRRAYVGDFFGVRNGEAFAASGYRNFSTFFGAANSVNLTEQGTWAPALKANPSLWCYGGGAGSFTSIAGLGNANSYHDLVTTELYSSDLKSAFGMLFGSWLGDWDSEDNILRTFLAMPSYGLASMCSGRPHWFVHHMALGETLGFGARLTQNNTASGSYQNQLNSCANQTHIALMGDPSLRLNPVAPVSDLAALNNGNGVILSWAPSPESVVGYHVYRAPSAAGPFNRLTTSPVNTLSYTDPSGSVADTYMVRAVKLEVTSSGSYYNPSQGMFISGAGASVSVGTGTSGTTSTPTTTTSGNSSGTGEPSGAATSGVTNTSDSTSWVDDAIPSGAIAGSDGGDSWNWIGDGPQPYSGQLAQRTANAAGLHQHFFYSAGSPLKVKQGDALFAYVYLDPNYVPAQVMLQWNDGTWEHRAYWGSSFIDYGTDGTVTRHRMGALPAAGQWARLEVPASAVGLEGSTVNGMAFTLYNGAASWDLAGKTSLTSTTSEGNTNDSGPATDSGGTTSVPAGTNIVVWVDDSIPSGAVAGTDGEDVWNWVNSNPSALHGSTAHQSSAQPGLHQHFFSWASNPLQVNTGDVLFSYVYLDPANPPSELMLQWVDGSWEHRAYWGANNITYGVNGTVNRQYVGPLPSPGQWACLQVPASLVGLEGSAITGMSFSQFDGRATWDYAGKSSGFVPNSLPNTNPPPVVTTNPPPVVDTNTSNTITNQTPGTGTTDSAGGLTNTLPGSSLVDGLTPQLAPVGSSALHVLAPTLLELVLVNSKQPDPARVTNWDLVDNNYQFSAPSLGAFAVTADGNPVSVTGVGFKRRPLYAPLAGYDLRIGNYLYLKLALPISDNQVIEVKNPDGTLWTSAAKFKLTADPLRYSPAIHVNQEGYMPNYPKVAMVGYYAGNLGEMTIPSSSGFKLVDANTGADVFQGTLKQRPDSGYTYSPTPYQKVYEADFSGFNTPGQYRLVVPGLGGSMPFRIDGGVAMAFARAYALGLYHQRCGTNTALPYTRFTHDICHNAPASVPMPSSSYSFTWSTIASYASSLNGNNPPQTAPALTSPGAQLFPFAQQGSFDTSGGHHDAGDYSKYTINSASLVHYLMFAVDSLPGVAALDNLGIPESGDGISDVMQEAKWEADFICKLQDTDGGFYFLVYPKDREYEGNVTPDHGDAQVVWPKTTSVTAASVAALAQCASSPAFKQAYPQAAALYLQKARLGWQFLLNAIAKYGKNGAYQKITHYGDDFADNDELAWAACQMYLATGDTAAHQKLLAWFDPSDPATWRWGWWHMSQCYGHAIRSYAFAVQTGRATASQLDAGFLSKCQAQIVAAGDDVMTWSQQSAYGTAFPSATKAVQSAGWYFSTDQAFDIAVAYQLNAKASYIKALVSNMNYEGGCNPVNVTYVTGLGWKRQRDIVSQWALNDTRKLPPSGIPVGNVHATFGYLWNYQGMLESLSYPADGAASAPYPFYDRWGDSWNVNAEFVVLNSARSIGTLGFLAAQTGYKSQAWKAPVAQLTLPNNTVPVGAPVTVTLKAPGLDLSAARVTWEARDLEPAYSGTSYTFTPQNNGVQWVEAEALLPDGRRISAVGTFSANSPNIVWVDDSLPTGAVSGADGGDSWNWVTSNPAPSSGTLSHQSVVAAGSHQHFFMNATATLSIGTGDILYAYVYLDPANPPKELMLQWDDGTWDHRAYWGANLLGYGQAGTPGRVFVGPLPAVGQWVQLKVPASLVNLEGRTVTGMAFTLYDGRATWDTAGRLSAKKNQLVSVGAKSAQLSRLGDGGGGFTLSREGDLTQSLSVGYSLGGTAKSGLDYQPSVTNRLLIIPAGAASADLTLLPVTPTNIVGSETITVTLSPDTSYDLGNPNTATIALTGNTIPVRSLTFNEAGATMSWNSTPNRTYRVAYKNQLSDPVWTNLADCKATNSIWTWVDPDARTVPQRFYLVAEVVIGD